jgi:hypothetical protein
MRSRGRIALFYQVGDKDGVINNEPSAATMITFWPRSCFTAFGLLLCPPGRNIHHVEQKCIGTFSELYNTDLNIRQSAQSGRQSGRP